MITGYDILCFAPGPWDDIWRNRHQIMSRLARANRVLWVEPWPNLWPTLHRLRKETLLQSFASLRGPRLLQVDVNLHVYQPATWLLRSNGQVLGACTQTACMALLRRVLRRLGFRSPILWLFLPDMEVFLGRFNEKLSIYHVVDDYSSYSGVSEAWRPVMQRQEEQLARRVDLVFVVSDTLLQRQQAFNPHSVLVANAVDYAAFAGAQAQAATPASMLDIPRPLAGYVGAINDKVDLALLARLARQCPDIPLVLVGPVTITDEEGQGALEELRSMPQVRFLGRQSATDVPRYVAACDVCLLPYRVNAWTLSLDSLKLYEYLACGKPVVATDVPTVRRVAGVTDGAITGHLIYVATTEREFAEHLQSALRHDNTALQQARQRIAARNTWDQRIETLSAAIESRLKERDLQSPG